MSAVEPVPSGGVFRVLITGSRAWSRRTDVTAALDALRAEHGPGLVVVHGGCRAGADAVAAAWAARTGTTVQAWPADWTAGRGAGPARNLAMVAAGSDLCLAFILDASPGASHCARVAEEAGIPVRRVTATTRTKDENQAAKADAIAAAMIRRGIGQLSELAHLDYSNRRKVPTITKFAAAAYREAREMPWYRERWGDPPTNAPGSRSSGTWSLVAGARARIAAIPAGEPGHVPVDLLHDRDVWCARDPGRG